MIFASGRATLDKSFGDLQILDVKPNQTFTLRVRVRVTVTVRDKIGLG